ncbi:MAG: hypothetical protein GXP06_09590 [Alphaproteobacteria bacterium]|nr:hypothetical protein [Alphaproteobacteria bacterium]
MSEDILIPFFVFSSLAVILVAAFHFSYKKRQAIHDTIRLSIEKTGAVDGTLVESILRDNVGPNADLRKGIILISVGAAFVILGYAIGEPDAIGPLMGVASFPGLIGLAYVAFHFFAPREPTV